MSVHKEDRCVLLRVGAYCCVKMRVGSHLNERQHNPPTSTPHPKQTKAPPSRGGTARLNAHGSQELHRTYQVLAMMDHLTNQTSRGTILV